MYGHLDLQSEVTVFVIHSKKYCLHMVADIDGYPTHVMSFGITVCAETTAPDMIS
jgi:hypothetical protein